MLLFVKLQIVSLLPGDNLSLPLVKLKCLNFSMDMVDVLAVRGAQWCKIRGK